MPATTSTQENTAAAGVRTPPFRCMKCKEHTETNDVQEDKMSNGRDCVRGICAVCGTKKFRIGSLASLLATAGADAGG